jgi:hypothetical protein
MIQAKQKLWKAFKVAELNDKVMFGIAAQYDLDGKTNTLYHQEPMAYHQLRPGN